MPNQPHSATQEISNTALALNSSEGLASANRPRSKLFELLAILVGWLRHHGLRATLRQIRELLVPFEWQAWRWTSCKTSELPTGVILSDDLTTLRQLRGKMKESAHDFFLDEIDGCRTCVYATVDGELAAIAWVHDYRQAGPFLRLRKGELEIRGVYTLPKFRGRGLAGIIVRHISCNIGTTAPVHLYATIHSRNFASQKTFQVSGYTRVAQWKRPAMFGPRYDCARGQVETWGEAFRHLVK